MSDHLIVVHGAADGPQFDPPYYLVDCDFEAGPPPGGEALVEIEDGGNRMQMNCSDGLVTLAIDAAEAKRFPSFIEAIEFWRRKSVTRPNRHTDGRPNRPLTAYTVEIVNFRALIERAR